MSMTGPVRKNPSLSAIDRHSCQYCLVSIPEFMVQSYCRHLVFMRIPSSGLLSGRRTPSYIFSGVIVSRYILHAISMPCIAFRSPMVFVRRLVKPTSERIRSVGQVRWLQCPMSAIWKIFEVPLDIKKHTYVAAGGVGLVGGVGRGRSHT